MDSASRAELEAVERGVVKRLDIHGQELDKHDREIAEMGVVLRAADADVREEVASLRVAVEANTSLMNKFLVAIIGVGVTVLAAAMVGIFLSPAPAAALAGAGLFLISALVL